MPQVLFEVVWDTSKFNNKADWPADGSQPFTWSFGDATGYANHADYVFGWKGDALQRLMDTPCVVNCPKANPKTQNNAAMNKCVQKSVVDEPVDGCKFVLLDISPLSFGSLWTFSARRVFADVGFSIQGLRNCLVDIKRNTLDVDILSRGSRTKIAVLRVTCGCVFGNAKKKGNWGGFSFLASRDRGTTLINASVGCRIGNNGSFYRIP